MNMVRCMLCDKKVPKAFWPEAAKWTVRVLNRSPTLPVKDKTPEEMWSGIKPKVDYFRVFGCLAHVHVPDQRRTKLDDKSLQCVLLGVSDESKAYRLFDPIARKIIVSRDVSFEEDKGWNWERTAEEVKRDVLVWEGSNDSEDAFSESEEWKVLKQLSLQIKRQKQQPQHQVIHLMKLHQYMLKEGFEEHLITCRIMNLVKDCPKIKIILQCLPLMMIQAHLKKLKEMRNGERQWIWRLRQ